MLAAGQFLGELVVAEQVGERVVVAFDLWDAAVLERAGGDDAAIARPNQGAIGDGARGALQSAAEERLQAAEVSQVRFDVVKRGTVASGKPAKEPCSQSARQRDRCQ